MKRNRIELIVFAIMTATLLLFASIAHAEEVMLEKKITNIVFKKDKNGQETCRAIVSEQKELKGVKYDTTATVMAFGPLAKDMRVYKKGSTMKVIANKGEFKGRTTYQVLKVIPADK